MSQTAAALEEVAAQPVANQAPVLPPFSRLDALNWLEIPTNDLDRAAHFYETLLGIALRRENFGEAMALFPSAQQGVGAALVQRPFHKPGTSGPLPYLNADGVLEGALARVEAAGGKVIVPLTPVPGGFGTFACVLDTEGNHVGLHAH